MFKSSIRPIRPEARPYPSLLASPLVLALLWGCAGSQSPGPEQPSGGSAKPSPAASVAWQRDGAANAGGESAPPKNSKVGSDRAPPLSSPPVRNRPSNPADNQSGAPPQAPAGPVDLVRAAQGCEAWIGRKSKAFGVRIQWAQNGAELWAKSDAVGRKPASTIKLLTTTAAWHLLGPKHRMVSKLWSEAPLVGGVAQRGLVLSADQDFSWSAFLRKHPKGPLKDLVAQAKRAGLRRVSGPLVIAGDPLLDGARFRHYRPLAAQKRVRQFLAKYLRRAGVKLGPQVRYGGPINVPLGKGQVLGSVRSPPLELMLRPINQRSHNQFAELLLRHIASAQGKPPEEGAAVVADWVKRRPEVAAGLAFHQVDGSGLSHRNRIPPKLLVNLLHLQRAEAGFLKSLALSGVRGTLRKRLSARFKGRVMGKTGTLHDTSATAGYILDKAGKPSIEFAFLLNQVGDLAGAKQAQDRCLRHLAKALDQR